MIGRVVVNQFLKDRQRLSVLCLRLRQLAHLRQQAADPVDSRGQVGPGLG